MPLFFRKQKNFFQEISFHAKEISKLTLFLGFAFILSSAFTRQLLDITEKLFGANSTRWIFGAIFFFAEAAIIFFLITKRLSIYRIFLVVLYSVVVLLSAWQLKIVAERIHVIEFGLLGLFLSRDLFKHKMSYSGVVTALIIGYAFAILDEVFQAVLPYRYFGIGDICVNCLGITGGIILYIAGSNKTG